MPRNPKNPYFSHGFLRVFYGFLRVFYGLGKHDVFPKHDVFEFHYRFLRVTMGFLRGPWVFFTWCFIFPKRSEQVQCCTVKRRFMDHWFLQVPLLGSFDVAPKQNWKPQINWNVRRTGVFVYCTNSELCSICIYIYTVYIYIYIPWASSTCKIFKPFWKHSEG